MIQVKFVGGAKKSFQSESLDIDKSDMRLDELLSAIMQKKPPKTPALDTKNILVAVNGADSSALGGEATILRDGDVVSIIPIIHGGAPKKLRLDMLKRNILVAMIKGRRDSVGLLESLREDFAKTKLQAVHGKFVLNKYHLEKIISLSLKSEKNRVLLSNKLETDILMRFALSCQISGAIRTAGAKPNRDFFLIAVGRAKDLDGLFKDISRDVIPMFGADNSAFLKRHFHITQRHLGCIYSKDPLADALVERAATLLG